jgi:hypothetical protein
LGDVDNNSVRWCYLLCCSSTKVDDPGGLNPMATEPTTSSTSEPQAPAKPKEIETQVSFPLSPKPAYKDKWPPDTVVSEVLSAAMTYFDVADSPTTTYKLAYKGTPVDPNSTVGEFVEHDEAVKFTLAKELIQG